LRSLRLKNLKIYKIYKHIATANTLIIKQVDLQFPNEKEITTIEDFREMVRNSEKSPHISFEEFCKVTDEWLSK
jgi:hypothetical protein